MVLSSTMPANRTIQFAHDDWALVVDDHPMFCDALELTLGSICDISLIRSANTIAEAAELIYGNTTPSLVVL